MFVTVEQGPDAGSGRELPDAHVVIGRHPECGLVLADEQASARHAALDRGLDGDFTIADMGSRNGTMLNGERITASRALRSGDVIEIGQSTLRVHDVDDPGAAPTRVAHPRRDGELNSAPPRSPSPPRVDRGPTGKRRRGRQVAGASPTGSRLNLPQVISRATPSVVRVLGKWGGGSGFVINAKKQLVLTNAHVALGGFDGDPVNSGLTVQVGNNPGTDTPARLVAASPADDLAVIQLVDPVPGLRALPLGNSAAVHPGDQVITLGFPGSGIGAGGATQTGQAPTGNSNDGIVTATQAQLNDGPSAPMYQDVIQHQAPINPGNSGGPLLNREGQVVGINTLGGLQGTQGQYYSIAINYAKRLLPGLEAGHSQSLIGWSLIALSYQDPQLEDELRGYFEDEDLRDAAGLAAATAQFMQANEISGVFDTGGDSAANGQGPGDLAGSPAARAGTQGFLIDSINGTPITSVQDAYDALNSAIPGQHMSLYGYDIDNPASDLSVSLAGEDQPARYRLELTEPSN